MKKILSGIAMLSLLLGVAYAADTDSVETIHPEGTSLKITKVTWQADGSGDKADVSLGQINGRIMMVVTDPGATAPADNYDITITDAEGIDVLGGAIANRDTTTTELAYPSDGSNPITTGRWTYGVHTMAFTDQANADCNGEVFIYHLPE